MKKRIISALIMAIITIPIVIFGNNIYKVFISALACCSLYEILKARNKKNPLLIEIMSYVQVVFFLIFNDKISGYIIITIDFLIIAISIVLINDQKKYNIEDATYLFSCIIFISAAFYSLIYIREKNLYLIILLGIITILNDMFAYFIGLKFGKKKLCPEISPNKTVEGLLGGIILSTIISFLYYYYFIGTSNIYLCIIGIIALNLIATIGDLFFSSIKRHFKIKDFSNIIPGHGGFLDRLDSLLIVCIAYVLILEIF